MVCLEHADASTAVVSESSSDDITLNHTIVPARDKRAAAQFFARIFGLHADPKGGHFAPVRINDTLTLLFDDVKEFESHHYAFHVSDAEFDAIFGRIREAKLAYGSAPWSLVRRDPRGMSVAVPTDHDDDDGSAAWRGATDARIGYWRGIAPAARLRHGRRPCS
jgi:catechol 2,3-dioxygenase-like lactoylglutathione lyase family enzyme